MIKFFRKARQKMLTENKLSKYLIYAFGEILLVVIGILIALQINNWNESIKLEKLEIKMLGSIKNGLEFDLQEIKKTIKFQNNIIKSQQIASDWLQNDLPFTDSIATHFMRTTYTSNFIFKNAPYETLKEIGLEIIRNDSLRDQISNMYDLKYEEIFFENRDLFKYKEHYRIIMTENRFEFLDKKNLYDGFKPQNVSELKSDKTYLFKLNILIGSFYLYNGNLRELENEVTKLIKLIEYEIDNR